jgi:sulfur relay protein TusB/DsrH
MEVEKRLTDSIVYLYGFSPTFESKLQTLLGILSEQVTLDFEISIVLIHDGIIGTSKIGITPKFLKKLLELPFSFYAIIPDIKARGMDPNNIIDGIKAIEYDDLVDILISNNKIVSWM